MTDKTAFLDHITETLQDIDSDGLMKRERLSSKNCWLSQVKSISPS